MTSRPAVALLALSGLFVLAGCQHSADPAADPAETGATADSDSALGDGHGAIAGARELAEPALHLTSVAPDGGVHHLDLLDGGTANLGEIPPADTVESEGRFLFATRADSVSVVDSGVWTWNHVDHFHYYEAPAAILGELEGDGAPHVVASDLGAGVFFDGGEAVLLDLEALKAGEIAESFRLDVPAGSGMVVPLPAGALVTGAGTLRQVDASGHEVAAVPCVDPAGSIATNVGVVVGCGDGAVLAVASADGTSIERIPYPADAPTRALSFAAREGRPTVAGFTGGSDVWLLDTRERTWARIDAGEPLVRVAAVDDADEHVVALAADGAVLVLSGSTGERLARTEPLVAASLADPAVAPGVDLQVDARRTYLNGPAEHLMYEIDPADAARIARTFETGHAPAHIAETGR